MKNLPSDLLHTFVTIVKEGEFSNAGNKLGRYQPAVSLQMNCLAEMIDRPIMLRNGRSFKLTEDGEVLLDYAQWILQLNDEVLIRLSKQDMEVKLDSVFRMNSPLLICLISSPISLKLTPALNWKSSASCPALFWHGRREAS